MSSMHVSFNLNLIYTSVTIVLLHSVTNGITPLLLVIKTSCCGAVLLVSYIPVSLSTWAVVL